MCRVLSTNRRRIHKVALSHCDGTDFIIYGREHSERCHRKSKRTGSKRRSANSGGARSESRSSSAMRASARAQKPRSSGKSPASVPEAGGRLVPVSAMACASLLHGWACTCSKRALPRGLAACARTPADLRGLSLEREDGGREGAEAEMRTRAAAAGVRP